MDNLSRVLRRAVLRALLTWGALAVALLLVSRMPAQMTLVEPPRHDSPAVVNPVETLLKEHRCWTGGEGHPFPGHVVVTRNGHLVYGGPKVVSAALDQVFNHNDHHLSVWGFCR